MHTPRLLSTAYGASETETGANRWRWYLCVTAQSSFSLSPTISHGANVIRTSHSNRPR